MVDVQGIPADVLKTLPPLSPQQVAAVPTIMHELTMLAQIDPQSLAGSSPPTLLLRSDHTAPFLADCAERIHQSLPSSEHKVLPGQWDRGLSISPPFVQRSFGTVETSDQRSSLSIVMFFAPETDNSTSHRALRISA